MKIAVGFMFSVFETENCSQSLRSACYTSQKSSQGFAILIEMKLESNLLGSMVFSHTEGNMGVSNIEGSMEVNQIERSMESAILKEAQ